jgi:ABC-type methionine transport system ATPase subunit
VCLLIDFRHIHLLNLMEQPSEGEIRIDGRNVQTFSKKEVRQQQQQMGMQQTLINAQFFQAVSLLKVSKATQHYHKFSNFLTNCNAETPSPFVVAAGELLF